ncbi:MAG: DNA-directed RNA polymerase subunit omega [Eubacterium sp.]|nr:DNA-directed RNA polymerase subunit omega [Eubacterium sp.]MDE6385835.1 DNA-directed RNA polymerase subunit omega [Eubacterium sp.]MDE7124676.1 DNA-directed RNA polymerase subunit omega [Eubacterium sp.]
MFNPDLKKLLKNCNSRYSLVVGTAKRAREIRDDAVKKEVLLDTKTVSLAIDDIVNGKYVISEPEELKSEE